MLAIVALVAIAAAQPPAELPIVADQLVATVTDGEYDTALQRAQDTATGMSARTNPPDPAALALLWQVIGAACLILGLDL